VRWFLSTTPVLSLGERVNHALSGEQAPANENVDGGETVIVYAVLLLMPWPTGLSKAEL